MAATALATGAVIPGGSIRLRVTPQVQYVLRLADTALIHAQRLAEWSGHGPVLEEDIAMSNLALDLLGQARALLAHAGTLEGQGFDEDALAFLRDEGQFFNLTLAEQPMRRTSAHSPGGDFGDAMLRCFLLAGWFGLHWQAMVSSSDAVLAGIAAKATKEVRYHRQHAADWVVRLGDGTAESAARMRVALERAWPYTNEMFQRDAADDVAVAARIGPARDTLRDAWLTDVRAVLAEARLDEPKATDFLSTGTLGRHSEHMGYILAEMQVLQRQYPGGRW